MSTRKRIAVTQATCLRVYGVKTPLESKLITAKRQATFALNHNGAKSNFEDPDFHKRMPEMIAAKYGAQYTSAMQVPEIKKRAMDLQRERNGGLLDFESHEWREKAKQSNLDKYGVEYSTQRPEVLERVLATQRAKFGGHLAFNTEKSRNAAEALFDGHNRPTKISDRVLTELLSTWLDSHDNPPTIMELQLLLDYDSHAGLSTRINKLGLRHFVSMSDSYWELQIKDFLDEAHIPYRRFDRQIIKPQELDFVLFEHAVAIEVNDNYTHSASSPGCDKPADYHSEKTRKAKQVGFTLIHIWEDIIRDPVLFSDAKVEILKACGWEIT